MMQLHIHLEPSLRHLLQVPKFKQKVSHAFDVQKTESKRVFWRGVGWIRFNPEGATVNRYIGHKESQK